MTEADLWFVFCLLSPLPQREETLHGLFSTPRRKIYPPKAGEYCTIVVLKKKSINFLPSWLHFRMIQTWWVQAAVWQSLPSKDWDLKGNGSLIQQNQIFFPPGISCSDFCFFLSAWGKLPHSKTQLSGKVQHHAWVLLTLYKMIFQGGALA